MKNQILTPLLVVIIMLVESISAVSLAANSRLSQNTLILTSAELLANQESEEGDRSEETNDDSDPCPEQINCGKI